MKKESKIFTISSKEIAMNNMIFSPREILKMKKNGTWKEEKKNNKE